MVAPIPNEGTFYPDIICDITERKAAEEALRRAYQETKTILASLPSSILIVNEALEVIFANTVAYQHFDTGDSSVGAGGGLPSGAPSRLIVGSSIFDVVPVQPNQWHRLAKDLHSSGPNQDGIEHHGEFETGTRAYQYRLFAIAMDSGGKAETGVVINDVTEQKQLQEQLIQAEKLSSLGTLVSGMAHEINNPIHGILSMAELILEETNPEKIKEYAQDIVSYSQHVGMVVRDFASYARPASRDRDAEVDLNERLLATMKMVRRSPEFGHVEVVTEFEPLPKLRARRSEIDQVFINLISNAVQTMAGQGRLTLTSHREGDWITAGVADTGAGIPKSHLNRIFDPFFTTKDPGKGTGLGLTIVNKIVTKYGGTITVESEDGKGSRFLVRFPVATVSDKGANDGTA